MITTAKLPGGVAHGVVEQVVHRGGRVLLRVDVVRFHSEFAVTVLAPAEQLPVGDGARVFRAAADAANDHSVEICDAHGLAFVAVAAKTQAAVVASSPRVHATVRADGHGVKGAAGYGANGGQAENNDGGL